MKKENRKHVWIAICMPIAFLLWTVAIRFIDVGAIGPQGSTVGFSKINGLIHNLTGVNFPLYLLTDWLGLIPFGFVFGFALLGLVQWIRRRHILKVDRNLLILGGFYVVMMAAFFLFEVLVINYRPVLIHGVLEASYPSSTTMLVLCVIPTAILQLNERIKNGVLKKCISFILTAFIIFMVIGRLFSGVHWFTDIIGGALFSAGLVSLYRLLAKH